MKHGLVLVVLALMLRACGPEVAAAGSDGEERRSVTASPPDDPSLVVGDEATKAGNGTKLTVRSYESPLEIGGAMPESGSEFSTVEVLGCAGPDSEGSLMNLGPSAFTLRMEDGTEIQRVGFADEGARVRRPTLESMKPLAGECDRGFVTFRTPRGEKLALVVYEEEFALKDPIAWRVPEDR